MNHHAEAIKDEISSSVSSWLYEPAVFRNMMNMLDDRRDFELKPGYK